MPHMDFQEEKGRKKMKIYYVTGNAHGELA